MARHWVRTTVIPTWTHILVHLGTRVPQRRLRIKVVLILLPVCPSSFSRNCKELIVGGSAYSSTPAAPAQKSSNVLPVKQYLSFKQINLQAVQTKVSQFAEELKAEGVCPSALIFERRRKLTISPVWHYQRLTRKTLMRYTRSSLLLQSAKGRDSILFSSVYCSKLGLRTRGSHVCPLFHCFSHLLFPAAVVPNAIFSSLLSASSLRSRTTLILVLDLARILATLSPQFGTMCTPDALLTACDWSLPHTNSKAQATNTLLALRTFANLFTTSAGRKGMVGMKIQEWLDSLRRGRSWEEVGARKLPYVTIVLKYVVVFVIIFFFLCFFLFRFPWSPRCIESRIQEEYRIDGIQRD